MIKAQLSRVEGPSESPKLNNLFICPIDGHFMKNLFTPLHVLLSVSHSVRQTDARYCVILTGKIAIDLIVCARA